MKQITFDFNNLFDFNIDARHGITEDDIKNVSRGVENASSHLADLITNKENRINLSLEWTQLPFQGKKEIRKIQDLGNEISKKYESVISLGIGGSYLGIKAAQDALRSPYYNEFSPLRKKRPKFYFEGNNLDPDTLSVLIKNLNPKKSFVIVISKSGETTETKAALMIVEEWLKKAVGKNYGRQIVAITDPEKGSLRKKVDEAQSKDKLSFRNLSLLKGVGGRFSELNMGLLHLAIVGIDIKEVLDGATSMAKRCTVQDLSKNPAYMYAALMTILYQKKGKSISIMMPFSETLKSTADWYVQLLAESLGKKYARKIRVEQGREEWSKDLNKIVNVGRTPVPARGTNDLHSIQQNNIEGENNKVVTFIRVDKFRSQIKIPGADAVLSKRTYSELIKLAQEGTAWALTREKKPNCTIIMPEVTPFHWGALLYFFEMATAFEGELLDVNAYDQPGVESYKNYMYYKLGKPGIPAEVAGEIKNNPTTKKPKYII